MVASLTVQPPARAEAAMAAVQTRAHPQRIFKTAADLEIARLKRNHFQLWQEAQVAQRAEDQKRIEDLNWRLQAMEARIGRLVVERYRLRRRAK